MASRLVPTNPLKQNGNQSGPVNEFGEPYAGSPSVMNQTPHGMIISNEFETEECIASHAVGENTNGSSPDPVIGWCCDVCQQFNIGDVEECRHQCGHNKNEEPCRQGLYKCEPFTRQGAAEPEDERKWWCCMCMARYGEMHLYEEPGKCERVCEHVRCHHCLAAVAMPIKANGQDQQRNGHL
ncbi:MAG: hypothetical protein M1820_010416 [Bogoriella megaspora]|nr:MAG: hypothetical protein M1820_010416 [Bogoriella megaspora]